MNVLDRFIRICQNAVEFLAFCIKALYLVLRFKRFPYNKRKSGRLALLANAPSLKEVLPRLSSDDDFKNTDFVVLNYFANCDEFVQIKPQHYCLADPMFYRKNHNYEKVKALFETLQKAVDWEMYLYVNSASESTFREFSGLTNKYVNVVPVMFTRYNGFEAFRNIAYRYNVAMPEVQTVAIQAIYVGVNLGYDEINLYGVDHTFFDGLCVNENNEVCMQDRHFYETEPTLKPIVRNDDDKIWKMSEYIFAIGNMFKSHDVLRQYADYMGTRIINRTKCSLIDSYIRG